MSDLAARELAQIEAAADVVRREALAIPTALYVPMPSREHYEGEWTAFLLRAGPWEHEYAGVDFAANRARCPETVALLSRLPVASVAGFLRLAPGARLAPHMDHRDDHEIRVHLALQLPPEEEAWWPLGTARLLDVRAPHGAINRSAVPRLTFTVDLRLPSPVPLGAVPPWGPPDGAPWPP